ncbi:MAG: hypothetical protein HY698_14750 [Deltaproteobacteria bacterium]|nr:hypothetical protein [Deltaproteobacteria bacterium]
MKRPGFVRFTTCLLLAGLILSCGPNSSQRTGQDGNKNPKCPSGTDYDRDGYGAGCPDGPDCDDSDPGRWTGCSGDCVTKPTGKGCPCEVGSPSVSCFDGKPEQMVNPPCMAGVRRCDPATKTWGECEGQVAPRPERCDTVDNDCDGKVDDGVLSMCGDCTPGCDMSSLGEGTPFPMPESQPPPGFKSVTVDGVGLNDDGDLVLSSKTIDYHFLWIANAGEGTVSKLDTRTGAEVARYASVTRRRLVNVMGAVAGPIEPWGSKHNPSRTAVDFQGNVWVANRAFYSDPPIHIQPTATKVMNLEDDCQDYNGNNTIDTSRDANRDGKINIADPAEFLGEDDECIKFSVIVGAKNGVGRAVAIDAGSDGSPTGNAWIGMHDERAFYQLRGDTGELIRRVPATGSLDAFPYGAAIDSKGFLWVPNGCCGSNGILKINTATGQIVGNRVVQSGLACGGSYGIAVDKKDRVWLGSWNCGAALRYNPADGKWSEVAIPGTYVKWRSRGVGVDAQGHIWVALHPHDGSLGARVARVNSDSLAVQGPWDLKGRVPVGIAVDFDGNVWTVNQSTSNASRIKLDPNTGAPVVATGAVDDVFPVGLAPYTYSDFTGIGLRTITRPRGDYTTVLEGCTDGEKAHWTSIKYDATAPAMTTLELWVRAGDDLATLAAQPLIGPFLIPPANLQAAPGPVADSKFLQVTFRLTSLDRETSPIVRSYEVKWTCPREPEG